MSPVAVNLSDSTSFEPIPAGAYQVMITKVESKPSRAGDLGLNWTLTIQEGEYMGQNLFLYTMLSGKGAFKLDQLLDAVGFEKPGKQFDFEPTDFMGNEFIAIVSLGTYTDGEGNSKPSNNVDRMEPVAKGRKKQ